MSESIQRNQTPTPSPAPRRTPLQSRSYLNFAHGVHQIQSPHQQQSGTFSGQHMIQDARSMHSQDNDLIYGTLISTKTVYDNLKKFVTDFDVQVQQIQEEKSQIVQEPGISNNDNPHPPTVIRQKKYMIRLNQLDLLQMNVFDVDASDIKEFDKQLYFQFIYNPAQMIVCFDQVIKQLYEDMFMKREDLGMGVGDSSENQRSQQNNNHQLHELHRRQLKRDSLMVGLHRLTEVKMMRNINVKEINRLICFRGIAIKTSDIIPEMKRSFFLCTNCSCEIRIVLENARVSQPKVCPRPGCQQKSNTFELIHNRCEFTDKQIIKLQQPVEFVPEGQTPFAISTIAYDYNVDGIRPGDRVEIVGIYRSSASKIMKSRSEVRSVFNTHIDMISFRLLEENRFKGSYGSQTAHFDDKDKEEFIKMANQPRIIEHLINSFAPSLYGHRDIKKGILAMLFGGTKKDMLELGRGRFRSDINICLIGDPSTAKSQLLQQVYKTAPRGVYTVGRGTTAVGLTANVRKDPQTKQFVLQSGALVLSDQGICCIDQFDKMDDNNKTILLQGMQQQTISIAKAGIVCSLNSRTAVIAAANPVNSRYNPKKSVVENINLPPALLSRFDLIYILLDKPQENYDRAIATHLLNLYVGNGVVDNNESKDLEQKKGQQQNIRYNKELLTKYITYARQYLSPQLSQQARIRLINAYTQMRNVGSSRKIITSTPRQLQSMIRLSEAFAKMQLSSVVTVSHVQQAIDLITIATQQAATDPVTGLIDMDVIVTGKTSSSKQKMRRIADWIKAIVEANVSKYKKTQTFASIMGLITDDYNQTNEDKPNEKDVHQALRLLESDGLISCFGSDKNRPNFKIAKDLS